MNIPGFVWRFERKILERASGPKINRCFDLSLLRTVILLQFPLSSLSDLRLVIAYGLELQEEEGKRSMMMIFVENL
jgi:hypothetical protein